MDFATILTFIGCLAFIFVFGKLFIVPLKSIVKLIINSILGGVCIYIINMIGINFGFHIGLNIITSIIIGILGLPGAGLLVILKMILRIKDYYSIIK